MTTDGITQMRDDTILTDPWAIVYKTFHEGKYQNMIFYLNEKHCYSTSNLNHMIARMEMNRKNRDVN